MSDTVEDLTKQATETYENLTAAVKELREAVENGEPQDRINALEQKAQELGDFMAETKDKEAKAAETEENVKRLSALEERIAELASKQYAPSKAAAILGGGNADPETAAHDQFLLNLAIAQSTRTPVSEKMRAEKALLDMGSRFKSIAEVQADFAAAGVDYEKAVLGDTDATGGYLAPRAVVGDLSTVAVANNPYRRLLTVVTGIIGPTVDIPHVGLAPTRATVVARGATKTNVNTAFTNYTATFYTLAQITDAAVQWLRQTRGRGEELLRARLGQAMALGESYYILQGSGTSEPKGILTSIGGSGTFVTTHTASNSTVAGSASTAIAKASGALANRNRVPDGVVMNAGDFWIAVAQGSDNAGFWVAPAAGPTSVDATGGFSNGGPAITIWGLPVYADPNMPADSLVVGQWKSAELYIGADVRVDSSDVAGTRWDQNLVGFRIEEDMAFNADPYVSAGLFQRIVDAVA